MDQACSLGVDMLIRKLGHELVEIRCRSLHSIMSKLEHGLLHESDLIQEQMLFVHLMEWFNHQPCPMQEDVLKLLISLSKHVSACDLLASLGAVQFFNDLRKDLESALKPFLDTLLDRLFCVKDSTLETGSHCTYRQSYAQEGAEVTPHPERSRYQSTASGHEEERNATERLEHVEQDRFERRSPENVPFIHFPGFPWHFLTATDRHVLDSTSSSLCSPNPHLVQNACLFLLDVVFKDFPAEIFLQRPTILNTLWTLLGTRPNSNLMVTVCECLRFITQSLTSRVVYFQDPAMFCPRQGLPIWSSGFRHVDQVEERPSRGFSTRIDADGQLQERHGGDGRDVNSSSSMSHTITSSMQDTGTQSDSTLNDEDRSLDEYKTAVLQLSQISVQHFCTSLLKFTIPLLQMDCGPLFLKVYEVAIGCLDLLEHILNPSLLSGCESGTAKEMKAQMSLLSEQLGEAVLYHYHLNCPDLGYKSERGSPHKVTEGREWSPKFESKYDATFHRLAFNACSALTVRFLKAVLPAEKACARINDAMNTALFVISCDEPLAILCGDIRGTAESYLEQCDGDKAHIFTGLRRVTNSLSHACQLILECGDAKKDIQHCLELAQHSVECLPYYTVRHLIMSMVYVVSDACNDKPLQSRDASDVAPHSLMARQILLQLLSHPITRVRSECYKVCLAFVQSVGDTGDRRNEKTALTFLMNVEVLYEMCLHGIGDSSLLVSTPAQELIVCLLQTELTDKNVWAAFSGRVKPVLPVLQAYQGEIELLRTVLFGLLGAGNAGLEPTTKVQCLIRALMTKQRSVRSIAAAMLSQVLQTILDKDLQDDTEDRNKLTVLVCKVSSIVGLTDLLMIDHPVSLNSNSLSTTAQGHGYFHDDAVVRALGIFRSHSIEMSVRKSALQQLAVMLTDQKLHEIFLKCDGLESIKRHLVALVSNNSVLTEAEKVESDACIMIIKSIALWNPDVRSALFDDLKIILGLLGACDLCRLSPMSLPVAVGTLALLLFCDVLQECKTEERGPRSPSVPAALVTRYQLPFLCPSHHVVSIHRVSACLHGHCDPLAIGPTKFAMLIHLFLTKNEQDVTRTLSFMNAQLKPDDRKQDDKLGEMSLIGKMSLTPADCFALEYTHPSSCLARLTTSLAEAESHDAVSHYISLMILVLESFPGPFSDILLQSKSWRGVMDKFLSTAPSSTEDETLLFDTIRLIDALLKAEYNTRNVVRVVSANGKDGIAHTLTWLINVCIPEKHNQENLKMVTPLFQVLRSTQAQAEPFASSMRQRQDDYMSMSIRRQLCKVTLSVFSRVARTLHRVDDQVRVHKFQVALCHVLLIRLKLADAPQFYDLPSMEVSLECLLHVTASCPGWTDMEGTGQRSIRVQGTTTNPEAVLCRQLTGTLLEVVSAFHIESRGSSKSYMGKGVSRFATMSIVSLAYETVSNENAGAVEKRLASVHRQTDDKSGNNRPSDQYSWMLPLWSARDPRIRHSGLALGVVLTRSVEGCIALTSSFEEWYGGLWNMAFGVLYDDSECSAVREQAAALICNLVSHEFCTDPHVRSNSVWLGPIVRDEEQDKILHGAPALVALLQHYKFAKCLEDMISHYYPTMTIQPTTTICTPLFSNSTSITSTQSSDGGRKESSLIQTGPASGNLQLSSVKSHVGASSDAAMMTAARPEPIQFGDESSQDGLNSFGSTATAAWRAVCTPSLMANVGRFLQNMLSLCGSEVVALLERNDVVAKLTNLISVDLLTSSLEQVRASSVESSGQSLGHKAALESHARSLILQYSETCKMLQVYASYEKHAKFLMLHDNQILKVLMRLLSVASLSADWDSPLCEMKMAVMNFISLLVQVNLKCYGECIASVVSNYSSPFMASMSWVLSVKENPKLVLSGLAFLNSVLMCISTRVSNVKEFPSALRNFFTHSTSEEDVKTICDKLVTIFMEYLTKTHNDENFAFFSAVANALQSLFMLSSASKDGAVQSGFIETTFNEVRLLLAKLELYRLHEAGVSKSNTKGLSAFSRKESDAIIRNITLILRVLSNLLHRSQDVKILASTSDLSNLLTKLLGWTSNHPSLLETVLRLATSYSACSEEACANLASGMVGQSSFVKHVIVIAKELGQRVISGASVKTEFLKMVHGLLCNLSASSECRSVMWKTSFLSMFQKAANKGQHLRCTRWQTILLACWVKLLHGLSFHTDGQFNILKDPDILEVLTEIRKTKKANSDLVVETLRNLCFHGPSKHRISSSKVVIRLLQEELVLDVNSRSSALAASAFFALLTDNHKSKVHLKGAGLQAFLQKMMCCIEQKVGPQHCLHQSLSGVLEILQS